VVDCEAVLQRLGDAALPVDLFGNLLAGLVAVSHRCLRPARAPGCCSTDRRGRAAVRSYRACSPPPGGCGREPGPCRRELGRGRMLVRVHLSAPCFSAEWAVSLRLRWEPCNSTSEGMALASPRSFCERVNSRLVSARFLAPSRSSDACS